MNSIDFCFWLQGALELTDLKSLDETQTAILKSHLDLVFKHEIDPIREKETTTPTSILNKVHAGNDTLVRC